MKNSFMLLLIVVLGAASGCFFAGSAPNASKTDDYEYAVSEEEMYLLYPQLLRLNKNFDEASAYYYLGDIESAMSMSEKLLDDIDQLRNGSPDPYVCLHLDSLWNKTVCFRTRLKDEEYNKDWQIQMTAVLDSIAENHVVEEHIEVAYNWRTEHWMKYFKGKGRRHFSKWLDRVESYRDIIEPILVQVGIPRDLIYLAVIESGLNLNARSNVNATGPWQFMAGTGRIFGLRINWWIDERKDIIASTYAAAHYLAHLHDLFGNWELALAAYNSGEYRVAHAISNQKTDDYWKLRLPSQTRWFVPKYMAALEIGRNPSAHGFSPSPGKPVEFQVITITGSTDLRLIAKAAGCTLARIKQLNPALKRWATPPGMEIELKVPPGTAETVLAAIESVPLEERVSWHRHQVKRGETISRIAAMYEISQNEIKKINGIRNVHKIREGSILLIPTKDEVAVSSAGSKPGYKDMPKLPDKIAMKTYKAPEGKKKVVYTVRDRDTLSEIAERFHVGLSKLRRWNNLRYSSIIHPGDALVIYADQEFSGESLQPGGTPDRYDGAGKKRYVHVVQKGETLSSISRKYRTRISDILVWNVGIKKDRLFPGDHLTIWLDSD